MSYFFPPCLLMCVAVAWSGVAAHLIAVDAVTVNNGGETTFNYPVKGPYLAGLKPAAAAITNTFALPTDGSCAGLLYSVSGSSGYEITLPSAASVAAGGVVAFSVGSYSEAAGQYGLRPAANQTVDGRSGSLVLIHTNFVLLVSNGANGWTSMIKKVDTDWVAVSISSAAFSAYVSASTTPTPGTIQRFTINWRRTGAALEARYDYIQSSGGSAGSGTYCFKLPNGFTADVSTDATSPLFVHATDHKYNSVVGSAKTYNGSNTMGGVASIYNNTDIALLVADDAASGWVGSVRCALSGARGYAFEVRVPIVNW